jgi:TonB-linked SusC/RagA family outer membrane protein
MKRDNILKTFVLSLGVALLCTMANAQNIVNRGDGRVMSTDDIVGAVSMVDVEKLKSYPDLSLSNALQGRAAGLIARPTNGGFGKNVSTLHVRGQHDLSGGAALVIVDGIPRALNNLIAEEIESIEVLKDITAKILYGPQAANGVVLVTTKRGAEGRRVIRGSAEYGVFQSVDTPEFLGSWEYATLYNQARENDGLLPRYTPSQLEGYKNSQGENDPLYPNVDWYGKFLRKQSAYTKATVEFSGGNQNVKYALVAGFTSGQGLEKVGRRTSMNQINVRGNLDIRISRAVTFKADVAGRILTSKWSMRNQAAIMAAVSTNRPNEYPLTIAHDFLGKHESEIPYFGGSTRVVNNLYADLAYSGNNEQRDTHSQMNLGLDFSLNHLVRGLSAEAYFTFDDYNTLTQRQERTYPTYSIREWFDTAGDSQVEIVQLKKTSVSTDQNISGNSRGRVMGARGNVAWNRTFGRHNVGAVLATQYFQQEYSGLDQDFKAMNSNFRLNYDLDRKYFAEFILGYMGANVYSGGKNQFMVAPAAGVAWVASREEFMKDIDWLDFLKLKASFGTMGSEAGIIPVGHDFAWLDDGTWTFGEANGTDVRVLKASVLRNPALRWVKQREMNVGVEFMALNQRLSGEVNWFHGKRTDIVSRNTNLSSALGDFYWYENVADVTNRGVDANLRWNQRVNHDLAWSAGVNFTFSKNRVDRVDEGVIEAWRGRVGKPSSANITLRHEGMFGPAANGMIDPATHPVQAFGPVQAGDLAYRDITGDGIVDGRDQEMIGQSFPLSTWGVDFNIDYKGFGLYVLGTAETGVQKLANTTYFQNYGENSYSVLARDAYHSVTNPGGTQPRLSTSTDPGNNWRPSEFWYRDCSFFRLKNVELSYTFKGTKRANGSTPFNNIRVFVRGTNLFVISPMKDADPERLLAGIENYPVYRAFTGGVSVTF